jgi:hypothetical protein
MLGIPSGNAKLHIGPEPAIAVSSERITGYSEVDTLRRDGGNCTGVGTGVNWLSNSDPAGLRGDIPGWRGKAVEGWPPRVWVETPRPPVLGKEPVTGNVQISGDTRFHARIGFFILGAVDTSVSHSDE